MSTAANDSPLHVTSGRWRLGLALAATTALLWGMLPIALKLLLDGMDPYTITWYRFLAAALVLGAFLLGRRRLPSPMALRGVGWLALIAVAGLTGNYLLYLIGLSLITPSAAQVVIQLGPLFLLLGGLLVFDERFRPLQWLGFTLLLGGLPVFFHRRIADLAGAGDGYLAGIGIVLIAGVAWAAYALAQRQLLRSYSSAQIMWAIYAVAVLLLAGTARPAALLSLDGRQLALLAFCCANTLIAYGCFAEALDHWETSRVGAVLSIQPLVTIAIAHVLEVRWPGLLAVAFAFVTDLLVLIHRGDLRNRERLSTRMADIVSELMLGSATLRHFRQTPDQDADRLLVDWALQDCLARVGRSFEELFANWPAGRGGWLVRRLIFPFGIRHAAPSDALEQQLAAALMVPSSVRDRLTTGMYYSTSEADQLGRLERALTAVLDAEPLERKLADGVRLELIPSGPLTERLEAAVQARLLTEEEAEAVRQAEATRREALRVDTA